MTSSKLFVRQLRKTAAVSFACLSLLLSGIPVQAAMNQEPNSRYLDSMDTLITLTTYGSHTDDALDSAEAEIERLNALLSTGLKDSEVSQLNDIGTMELSADTCAILEKSLELYDNTGGLFDVTIYPLMKLWGFTSHEYHVPTEEELADALSRIGSDRITYDKEDHVLTLDEGQSIDFGGIAKGYTSQRIMDIWRNAGLTSGMVSLGGNVQCLGHKPDGSDYVIAIRNPYETGGDFIATVKLHDAAVITSGGYERYFTDEATGTTYQHIMDPRTGYPAETDLASVSIVSSDGMLGDGLSTSLYIMGLEDAMAYWKEHHTEFQMILADQDQNLYVTEGLADRMLSPETFEVIFSE